MRLAAGVISLFGLALAADATADEKRLRRPGAQTPASCASCANASRGDDPKDLRFVRSDAETADTQLVVGDSFVDASDGSVESHIARWSLDGAPAVSQLPNVPFPAGPCGSHTVSFSAVYGASQNLVPVTTPTYTLDVPSVRYSVRPFVARIGVASANGGGARFLAAVRVGATAIAGGAAAAAAFAWDLLDAAGGTIRSARTSATLGTAPEFPVSSAELATAKSVRLTVTLADAGAITAPECAGMTSSSDSTQLVVPDPVLTVNGCTALGGACSITAASASGQDKSGWTYTWFLNDVLKATTTVSTYTPTLADIAAAGSYRVKVVARNESGLSGESPTVEFTLAGAECAAIPEGVLSFTWRGVDGCAPGACTAESTIRFNPTAMGYAFQDCDRFLWSFGDGATSTEKVAQHKFAASGSYSVTLLMTNDETPGGRSVTREVSIVAPSPSCESPSPLITVKALGTTSGCTGSGVPCAVGESIAFTAVNSPATKDFQSCDRFVWSFGDGTTSEQQNPTKAYATAGAYTVKLTVSNATDPTGVAVSLPITVGATECKAPTDGGTIDFAAPSGCSKTAGSPPCRAGEIVTLALKTSGSFQACDTFDWDFGDGSSLPGAKITTVQHQFPATKPEYIVTVTIRNSAGSTKVSQKVLVTAQAEEPKSVDFAFSPMMPRTGVAVTFTATAPSGVAIAGWQWDFGDGSSASGNPVQHTFKTDGARSVKLTATRAGDSPITVVKEVRVLKASEFAYLLPVVSHLDGANGSKWRTDLEIYNGNAASGPVELELELTSAKIKKTLTLNVATLIYEDFMSFFTSSDAAGPVILRGSAPHDLQIWTRTYSIDASGSGTYGHLIPAVRIDGHPSLATGSSSLYLTSLNLTPRYRTNVYLLNITEGSFPVTLTAYQGEFGSVVGQLSKEVAPFELTPLSAGQIPGAPTTGPFSVAVQASSGGLIAYQSVVDNGSNDPIYIPAITTSDLDDPDARTQIVPSVGHFQSWRSDLTIFNPDDQEVRFDLAFHDGSGALKAEAKNLTLPPKALLQLDDVVRSPSMTPRITTDVIGTLRMTVSSQLTDRFPVIAQRNYSDAGDQRRFGQGILGFAPAAANVSAGKPAILPAGRSDSRYYSNVGVVNVGSTDANIVLKLLGQKNGEVIGTHSITLRPNESRILQDIIRYLHPTEDRASIRVEVTGGSIWAFASIIDRVTKDPEYVPAIPLD